MRIKDYIETGGISPQTFYSRLRKAIAKGEDYPYPPREPFSQYDALLKPPSYKKKEIDFDAAWEASSKYQDPDAREIHYLKLLKSIFPEIEDEVNKMAEEKARKDTQNPYIVFMREQGLGRHLRGAIPNFSAI